MQALVKTIKHRALQWAHVVKLGHTHLQDATPLTVGQEWSGYATQLRNAMDIIKESMKGLYELGQVVQRWELG